MGGCKPPTKSASGGPAERSAPLALRIATKAAETSGPRVPSKQGRIRLRDLAASRVKYGYRRLHILLEREGWQVNHKLVYRLYLEEGLPMRIKTPKRHKSCRARVERPKADRPNESWSMDFMSEQLFDGRMFRLPTPRFPVTR